MYKIRHISAFGSNRKMNGDSQFSADFMDFT